MTNREKKIVSLLEEGFSYETIKKMSDTHINLLYNRLVKEAVVRVPADKYDVIKDKVPKTDTVEVTEEDEYFDSSSDDQEIIDILFGEKKPYKRSSDIDAMKSAKKDIKPHYYKPGYPGDEDVETSMEYAIGVDDPRFMMDEGKKTPITTLGMFEGELKEKSVSQQQQKLMGLALSVKRGETPKSGVSEKVLGMVNSMTEKELEDFASTKHKGLPKKKKETKKEKVRQIEESIVSLIKKTQGKVLTKKDILSEEPKIAPAQPKVNPGTKPERFSPYRTKPGSDPKPKAGTEVKPAQPKVDPGTKPERLTPYRPKPGSDPKPKAGDEGVLPEFLTFNNLNIKFRDE